MGKLSDLLGKVRDEIYVSEETDATRSDGASAGVRREMIAEGTADDILEEMATTDSTDGTVKEAYSKFSDPSAKKLYRVESISQTVNVADTTTRNAMVRDLLTQFGESLESLRSEALNRADSIQTVQREFNAQFEEESQNIENEIEKWKEDIEEHKRQLEAFIAEANQRIDELKASKVEKTRILAANLNGAKAEIQRLNKIIEILTAEED